MCLWGFANCAFLPARYDPQYPSLLDFLSGCLVRVLWTCLSSTNPARDAEQVTPYHRASLFLIKTAAAIAISVLEYGLGTVISVLGPYLGHIWVRFEPYLGRTWVRFGPYLGAVWVQHFPYPGRSFLKARRLSSYCTWFYLTWTRGECRLIVIVDGEWGYVLRRPDAGRGRFPLRI